MSIYKYILYLYTGWYLYKNHTDNCGINVDTGSSKRVTDLSVNREVVKRDCSGLVATDEGLYTMLYKSERDTCINQSIVCLRSMGSVVTNDSQMSFPCTQLQVIIFINSPCPFLSNDYKYRTV